ncbi:MAG: hypothetical protein D6675_01210 [Gemmatimonadetes bacterium]|nr:MAG: hypothetical protein D6675_01210 [Gemmatimonadota bacterium]
MNFKDLYWLGFLAILPLLSGCEGDPHPLTVVPDQLWQPAGLIYGGNIEQLNVLSDGHLVVRGTGSHLFWSADGGNRWEDRGQVHHWQVDATDNLVWIEPPASPNAAFRWVISTDQGQTWQNRYLSIPVNIDTFYDMRYDDIQLHMAPDGVVYLHFPQRQGTRIIEALYRSTDNGYTWSPQRFTSTTSQQITINDLRISPNHILYLSYTTSDSTSGISHHLLISRDQGQHWDEITQQPVSLKAVGASDQLYAVMYPDTDSTEFVRWHPERGWASVTLPGDGIPSQMWVRPRSDELFLQDGASKDIFYSPDGGQTWSVYYTVTHTDPYRTGDVHLAFGINDDLYLAVPGNLFYVPDYTTPNPQFRKVGMMGDSIWKIVQTRSGDLIALGQTEIYRSSDEGDHWTLIPTAATTFANIFLSPEGDLYGVTEVDAGYSKYTQLHLSHDNGRRWEKIHESPFPYFHNLRFTADGKMYASYQEALLVSTDRGRTWGVQHDFGGQSGTIEDVRVLSDQQVFVLTRKDLWKATNGADWVQMNIPPPRYGGFVRPLGVDAQEYLYLWANTLYRSTDYGVSWVDLRYNLGPISRYLSNSRGDLFAVIGDGVFAAYHNGDTWIPYTQGLPAGRDILAAVMLADDRMLVTSGGRFYRTALPLYPNW